MPRLYVCLPALLLAALLPPLAAQAVSGSQPVMPPSAVPTRSFRLHPGPANPVQRFDWPPAPLNNRTVAERDTCLKLRGYRFEKDAGDTGAPAFSEYSECQPGSKFGLRQTLAVPQEQPVTTRQPTP